MLLCFLLPVFVLCVSCFCVFCILFVFSVSFFCGSRNPADTPSLLRLVCCRPPAWPLRQHSYEQLVNDLSTASVEASLSALNGEVSTHTYTHTKHTKHTNIQHTHTLTHTHTCPLVSYLHIPRAPVATCGRLAESVADIA